MSKTSVAKIIEHLEDVAVMSKGDIEDVVKHRDDLPAIVRQFGKAIYSGNVKDMLAIIDSLPSVQYDDQVSIEDLAVGDSDEAFYEELIKRNAQQLSSSSISPQEAARLSQNINIFRKELREIRSRRPKHGTVLERVIQQAAAADASKKAKSTTEIPTKIAKTAPKPAGSMKRKKMRSNTSGATKNASKKGN